MINIYSAHVAPLVLRHRVNGKDGFVILPESEDDDGIYFEDFDTLKAWVEALAGQIMTVSDPAEIEWYDDWAERVDPHA